MKPSLLLWAYAATGALSASWIAPGAVWTDTDGNKIDAHGGGVVKRGDIFSNAKFTWYDIGVAQYAAFAIYLIAI